MRAGPGALAAGRGAGGAGRAGLTGAPAPGGPGRRASRSRVGALAAGALVGASAAASPPRLGPADHGAREGHDRRQARIRNIHGVLRLRLLGGITLRDPTGPYLLLRVEARNARDRAAEIRRQNLAVRLPGGRWLAAAGVADRPPMAGGTLRLPAAVEGAVRVPRDRTEVVFAHFRTAVGFDAVDPAARYDGRPYFLRRPLRAGLDALVAEAVGRLERRHFAFARGLLAEAATAPREKVRLGWRLVKTAAELRRAGRPVLEDRVLRLALAVAPNPAYVQNRLAELRDEARRRGPADGWGPPAREGNYHRRRGERYAIGDDPLGR